MEELLKKQARLAMIARDVGGILKDELPEGAHFALVLTDDPSERGFMSYASDLERTGVVNLLREMADALERGEN